MPIFRPLSLLLLAYVLASAPRSDAAPPHPEIFEPGRISTGDDESHPAVSPDGKTLYFLRNTPDFRRWTIVESHLVDGRWSLPEVAPFSGRHSDADPSFSADGQTLFFISNRPLDGKGQEREDTEIWRIRRLASGWGEPEHLDVLSSPTDEWFPTATSEGNLYFGSERAGGVGGVDVWRSRLVDGHYATPENLGAPINSAGHETEPFIAPDESYLILATSRPGGLGAYDLYVSYRCDGRWTDLAHLPGDLNSPGWDFSPRMSPDGRSFFFTSNRVVSPNPGGRRLDMKRLEAALHSPGNGLRDVYRIDAAALGLRSPCR